MFLILILQTAGDMSVVLVPDIAAATMKVKCKTKTNENPELKTVILCNLPCVFHIRSSFYWRTKII